MCGSQCTMTCAKSTGSPKYSRFWASSCIDIYGWPISETRRRWHPLFGLNRNGWVAVVRDIKADRNRPSLLPAIPLGRYTEIQCAPPQPCQKSPISIAHALAGIAGIFAGIFLFFLVISTALEPCPNVFWGSRESLGVQNAVPYRSLNSLATPR